MKCDGLLGGQSIILLEAKHMDQEIHSICAKHNQHVLYANLSRNILNNKFNLI